MAETRPSRLALPMFRHFRSFSIGSAAGPPDCAASRAPVRTTAEIHASRTQRTRMGILQLDDYRVEQNGVIVPKRAAVYKVQRMRTLRGSIPASIHPTQTGSVPS